MGEASYEKKKKKERKDKALKYNFFKKKLERKKLSRQKIIVVSVVFQVCSITKSEELIVA